MDDLISRQAAIDALWAIKNERESVYYTSAIYNAVDAIEALPSTERRGRWVGIDDEPFEVWECDRCGHIIEVECPPRFCEECGARMEASE